jgi:hypothetical protein
MSKQIENSGAPPARPDAQVAANAFLTPSESLAAARMLHDLLIDNPAMPSNEKAQLARQISGRLFAAECDRIFPPECRVSFRELRNDAHLRAAEPNKLSEVARIRAGYNKIENELSSPRTKAT